MFIGHFAVALAAKRVTPATSLGVLFASCQLADLIWPTLVLVGVEHVAIDPGNTAFTPLNFIAYPYSHSLAGLLLWAALAAMGSRVVARSTWTGAAVVAGLVFSHWLLDFVTHRPDLPLSFADRTHVGLGLWNSVAGTVTVETAMFLIGLGLYLRTTRAADRVGSIAFWSLIVLLAVVNVGNIVGPPPPSATAVAWSAQVLWLVVAWAWWADAHRLPKRVGR